MQEQISLAMARMEEEKAAAVRRAREAALDHGVDAAEREAGSWKAREAALRRAFDMELADARAKLGREIDEERRRGLDLVREENNKHVAEVYAIQAACQAKIAEVMRNAEADRVAASKSTDAQLDALRQVSRIAGR